MNLKILFSQGRLLSDNLALAIYGQAFLDSAV
jgi:hypothetical protein